MSSPPPRPPAPTPPPVGAPAAGAGTAPAAVRHAPAARWIACLAGAVAALAGGTYLALWALGLPPRWSARGVLTVKTNMALAQLLGGAALLLLRGGSPRPTPRRRAAALALAGAVLLVGGLTLVEYALDVDLGIDQLLAVEPAEAVQTLAPNRMGPPGALSLTLLGAGLLALGLRRRAVASWIGALTCCVVLVPAVGFVYRVGALYSAVHVTIIAWPTVVALGALGLGLAVADAEGDDAPILWRDDPGGALFRRLVVPVVVLPIALGFLRLAGERRGLYERYVGTGLFAVSLSVLGLLLLWRGALWVSAYAAASARSQAALRAANERLREADRRKDEFLGMLSHELRNPLAPIRNSLHILERVDPAGAQARRAREVAGRQVTHLTRLVDDLLDVTRIARGKVELRRAALDLAALARRTAEDHRALLAERGLALELDVPAAPVPVAGDETRLAQVIGNLLQNAAKFTPAGGRVAVEVAAESGAARVRVRDTGAGIEPALLREVFEPFTQAEQTLARSEGGLGLGLALVKGLVELHGGDVAVESDGPGRGSAFSFRIPLAPEPAAAFGGLAAPAAPRAQRWRVLVVDDNRDAAESLAELVAMLGHEVEVAYDGPTALARASARAPDVVLCDLGLPGMSGYDVARTLRARGPGRVRLVAVSGYAAPGDVQRAAEAGFDAHVAKPPDPAQLERLLA